MNDDLIAAFWERDLTDAEDGQLAGVLEASADQAERFADLAGAFYARLGLPEPRWPGEEPPRRRGPALLWLVAGLTVLAGGGWWAAHRAPPDDDGPDVLLLPPLAAPAATPRPTRSRPRPVAAAPATPTAAPATAPDGGVATDLVVKIRLAAPTALAVDIFDPPGHHIRRLVAGLYPAGVHRFPWDAADGEGRAVAAGYYRVIISVAGGGMMDRWVHVAGAAR